MMNFPTAPAIGQPYTFGDTMWAWNGKGWEITSSGGGGRVGIRFVQQGITELAQFSLSSIRIDVT
jgi:hypothetical protein